jgi:beta-xylosidase
MKRLTTAVLFGAFIGTMSLSAQFDNAINTYRNPVISGAFPDPTIIRVGNDYYASGTSGNSVPVYPLYHSTDLINWSRIGAIFNQPPEWTSGAFWAPELFYNNGTYYAYYTAKRKSDNISCVGVATTKDITKGFQDQGIIIDWGQEAIDAFDYKESDGKLYIIWKAYGLNRDRKVELLASELSPDGLKMVGEHFSLTRYDKGWTGHGDDEGPCLVKHDQYYYLFYSGEGCCNNRCGYKLFVQRSKTLKGDWEQYKGGSILQGGEQWKCSGHGTLVETPDNRYFFLYHAFNAIDFEYIGRMGLLDEFLWDKKSGWPFFKYGNTPTSQAEVPFRNTFQKRESVYHDDFTSMESMKYWQWDMSTPKPDVIISNNRMVLTNINPAALFMGLSPMTGTYSVETCVVNKSQNFKGLAVFGGRSSFLRIGTSNSKVILTQSKRGAKTVIAEYELPQAENVYLRIMATNGRLFRFYWSVNQKEWFPCTDKEKNEYINGTFLEGARPGLMVETGDQNEGVFSFINAAYSY